MLFISTFRRAYWIAAAATTTTLTIFKVNKNKNEIKGNLNGLDKEAWRDSYLFEPSLLKI